MEYSDDLYKLELFDRIEAIKQFNQKYDLENNAYISFSGGKDSTCISYLIDKALPGNKIPRVFVNTGLEYLSIAKYVRELAKKDDRIKIIIPKMPLKTMLEDYGYPFKSKDFSQIVSRYQRLGMTKSVKRYLELDGRLACPNKLKCMFTPDNKLKISDKCCLLRKEKPLEEWAKENNKHISIIGILGDENGRRSNGKGKCFTKYREKIKFYPLRKVNRYFERKFIEKENIQLCELYYPPYNFKRTGCKGCPFAIYIKRDLEILKQYFPNEYKQCMIVWKPVYDRYKELDFRLPKEELTLFDFEEEKKE